MTEEEYDVLDTMAGAKLGVRWTMVQICEDTGREEPEVERTLETLERKGFVRWKEGPYAFRGWYLMRAGGLELRAASREPQVESHRTPGPKANKESGQPSLGQIEQWAMAHAPPKLATSRSTIATAIRHILWLVAEVRKTTDAKATDENPADR